MEILLPESLLVFVREQMESFQCGAHHMDHVKRVVSLARRLARDEGADEKLCMVAALCHDVLDSKLLAKSAAASAEEVLVSKLKGATVVEGGCYLSEGEVERVMFIVKNIGYRRLLDSTWNVQSQSAELRCVQDADLLDAIGMTGVARCYAFGGKRNRSLFDLDVVIGRNELTPEVYANSSGSGLEHFFEKLLRIPDLMTTTSGAKMAKTRQNHMLSFIIGLRNELLEGSSDDSSADTDSIFLRNLFDFIPKERLKELEGWEISGKSWLTSHDHQKRVRTEKE